MRCCAVNPHKLLLKTYTKYTIMKLALIIHDEETRKSFHRYLSDDKKTFKKVFAFNSFDTFISDAYMLTDVEVVLLDMHLAAGIPALEGLDIIENTRFLRKARVLMLTSIADNNYTIFKWLCSYGTSYIDREMALFNIKNAITSFSQRKELLVPVITKHKPVSNGEGAASGYGPVAPLTSRERQIMQHVIDRENESEIAEQLNIRRGLVRKYIRTTFSKIKRNTNLSLHTPQPDTPEMNYKRVG
jgi:DNA-binding NarL/FixJ family response regulator